MKNTVNLFLLIILAFGLMSCDRMLKSNSLNAGYGDVILKSSGIDCSKYSGVTVGALDIENAKVKINGETTKVDTTLKNLPAGTYDISLSISAKNGSGTYSGSGKIEIKVNEIADARIQLTTFTPKFYLTGSLMGNGTDDWNAGQLANLMTDKGNGVYEKTLTLTNTGTMTFLMTTSDWATKYTGSSNLTVGNEGSLIPAEMTNASVNITQAGKYKIIFDTVNMKVKVETLSTAPIYYLVGSLMGDGTADWNVGQVANEMTDKGNGVYEKTLTLTNTGLMDFQMTTADWATKYTGSTDISLGVTGTLVLAGMANAKVNITQAGDYKITINTTNMTVKVEKIVNFYLVGKLMGNGTDNWNAGQAANLMTDKGNGVYEKTLTLTNTGLMDFQMTTADWATKYTSSADIAVGATGTLVPAGMANAKANITQAGDYKITIDTTNMTVKVEKLVNFYLVGSLIGDGVANWGAGQVANLMIDKGNGVYEKTLILTNTGLMDFQMTTADWATKYTGSTDISVGATGTLVPAGMANAKVNITQAGDYKITIDITNMTVKVESI